MPPFGSVTSTIMSRSNTSLEGTMDVTALFKACCACSDDLAEKLMDVAVFVSVEVFMIYLLALSECCSVLSAMVECVCDDCSAHLGDVVFSSEAKNSSTWPLNVYGDAVAADNALPIACFGEMTGSAGELGRGKLTMLTVTTGSSFLLVASLG